MRDSGTSAPLRIGSLTQLDELVGQFVAGENPPVHWEDVRTQFRFDTMEEAADALHDPFLREFLIPKDQSELVFTPVKEFRPYSSALDTAWHLVERFDEPLHVRRRQSGWIAAFGGTEAVVAPTAPVAICLAALRAKGIEVEIAENVLRESTAG